MSFYAAVQMDCIEGDLIGNTDRVIWFINEIMSAKPETVFIAFPEMVLYGYSNLNKLNKITQDQIDVYMKNIAQTCKKRKVTIVVGAPSIRTTVEEKLLQDKASDKGKKAGKKTVREKTEGPRNYDIENSLYLISAEGMVHNIYSKMHLIAMENTVFHAGETFTICNLPFGRIGFLICWDCAFAEAARLYAKEKAELLVVSAGWEKPYGRQWELAVCGRAFDNSLPVIASNRVGEDGNIQFAGHSMITDSMGNILSFLKEEEGYVAAEFDFNKEKEKQKLFGSVMAELREDAYRLENVKIMKIPEAR